MKLEFKNLFTPAEARDVWLGLMDLLDPVCDHLKGRGFTVEFDLRGDDYSKRVIDISISRENSLVNIRTAGDNSPPTPQHVTTQASLVMRLVPIEIVGLIMKPMDGSDTGNGMGVYEELTKDWEYTGYIAQFECGWMHASDETDPVMGGCVFQYHQLNGCSLGAYVENLLGQADELKVSSDTVEL